MLGDRSLKFKYTNPNVVFVAVETTATTADSSRGTKASRKLTAVTSNVTAMLVSTADGAVLYQQVHEAAMGPVQVGGG